MYQACTNYLLGKKKCVQDLAFLALNTSTANHFPEEDQELGEDEVLSFSLRLNYDTVAHTSDTHFVANSNFVTNPPWNLSR